MFCTEIVKGTFTFTSFQIFHNLCKDIQNLNQTVLWIIYLLIEYRIKMEPHRLIHDIDKPVLFICKLNKSLCTSLHDHIIKSILMIDIKLWLNIR